MKFLYGTSTSCAPKAKGKKTPAAAAGGPGGRAVDAGEGVVIKQESGDDSDKENEEGNLQLTGNCGTLQSQNRRLARGRN